MPLGLLGVLDLSIVTDTLIKLLEDCRDNSPLWNPNGLAVNPGPAFTIKITGSMPETVRNDGDCQLSLYLFHIAQDKFQRNSPVMGSRSSLIPQQPMSLDLYYLLTAHTKDKPDYVREQQAMSIAIRCFYENPIVRKTVLINTQNVQEEFCLTMDVETADELSRLWQSFTTSFRLSVVYKVSVVFITPDVPGTQPAPHPQRIGLSVNPTLLPYVSEGQVFGTLRTVIYTSPDTPVPPFPPAVKPDIRRFDLFPATVAAGQRFLLQGAGLNQATSRRVYLLLSDGTEYEVTSWVVPDPDPQHKLRTDAQITLELPTTLGAPPNTPPAGVYQLRVGSDKTQGDAQTIRSNATPFGIAARVDIPDPLGPPQPPNPPLLTPAGGIFTLNGAGFIAGKTEVLLDTVPLTAAGGTPAAGEFNVNAGLTAISFRPPGNLPPGRYTVRVRVNQVESAPAWWVKI